MNSKSKPLSKHSLRSVLPIAVLVIGIAVLGSYLAFSSHAATPFVASEVENGTIKSPATATADTTASGGKAVQFTTASSGGGGGGTVTGMPKQTPGYWWSTLESVPIGTASCSGSCNAVSTALKKEWTYFGQPGQEDYYGYPEIVSAAADGLPTPPAGDKVLRLHHALGDTAVMHKLFKTFTTQNWPDGALVADGQSPADASARYIVYQYIPSAKFIMTSHGFVNLLQFKETINTQAGFQQDPTYWVTGNTGGPYKTTMNMSMSNAKKYDMAPYMDRWVKWEFRLYQGQKLEWYMDDKLMDTAYQSQGQIGPQCKVGGTYKGSTITSCKGWIFGAGNYSSNQSLSGPNRNLPDYNYMDTMVYVDLSTVQPLQ